MGGYQSASYGDSIVSPLGNEAAWSAAGNLFRTSAKNFDIGFDYRHAERELINRDSGNIDRLEAAFKYSY